jgi:hypothetical protein
VPKRLETKALISGLNLRERRLELLAASTALRQSALFGLKWGDINFAQATMSVTRSIVHGVVGPCKTESSQKLVPVHPNMTSDDWVFCKQTAPCQETNVGPGDFAHTPALAESFLHVQHIICRYLDQTAAVSP